MHCVDLGESFPTHIYLQNLASIQPRGLPASQPAENEPFQVCPLSAYRSPRFVHGDIAAEGDYVLIPEGMSAETTVDMLKEVNAKVRKLVWFREMKRANKSRVSFKWEPFSVSPIGHELPSLVETKGKIGK